MHDDRTPLDASGAEQDEVSPADARLLRVIDSVLERESPRSGGAAPLNVEVALSSVRARIAAETGATVEREDPRNHPLRPTLAVYRAVPATVRHRSWSRRVGGLAAAAGLVIAAGIGVWRLSDAGSRTTPEGTSETDVAASGRVFNTAVGVRDSVVLADGSHVVLAPGSRLTVASDFATSRAVELEGAAFFDVKHDEAHPFTVRSNGAEVRDVGTAFSVNTDARGGVVVAVTEGVVALRGAATTGVPVELRAGDRGVIRMTGPESGITVQRGLVTAADVAWTRGELSYRDAPLREVQADLRRWFGIELETADAALGDRTLTASLRADSASQALRIIAAALGVEMTQKADTVVLRTGERGIRP